MKLAPTMALLVICGGSLVPVTLIMPALLRLAVFQLRPGQSAGRDAEGIVPVKVVALNSLNESPLARVPERFETVRVPPKLMTVALSTSFVAAGDLLTCMN